VPRLAIPDEHVRLECLREAVKVTTATVHANAPRKGSVVELARDYYEFVKGGSSSAGSEDPA